MQILRRAVFSFVLTLVLLSASLASADAAYKVLVVMSYEDDYLWSAEIREGIEQVFGDEAELSFFYMNTKKRLQEGPQRAAEAYQLYLEMQPDGVIAADDNAQTMFVVPYLRDKVETPVMFCGVNGEPEDYGYPAKNVSGILERYHLEETIAFNRLFAERIERFVFMGKDGPSAELVELQFKKEAAENKLSAEMIAFLRPTTRQQALEMAREYREKADLLIVETLQGVTDKQGNPLIDADVLPDVFREFDKPTATNMDFAVKFGALASVVKTGQEQGVKAARMLLQAMQGLPLAELPITRNYRGKRMVNVSTMRRLGISPQAIALRGAELVRTEYLTPTK